MKPSAAIRPISYLKAHASEILRGLGERQGTMIVTHRGRARAVLLDIRAYEELQESLALLRMLAQSRRSARTGRVRAAAEAFRRVRARLRRRQTA